MKNRVSGIITLEGIIAAAIVATMPLMAQASEAQSNSASVQTAQASEIAGLKRQLYLCHHHKRHHRATVTQVIEKRVVVEKPVIIEKERIVEKQVFVDRPIEKQVVVEKAVEMDRRVVVEHSKHRKHLLHLGIPFLSANLF